MHMHLSLAELGKPYTFPTGCDGDWETSEVLNQLSWQTEKEFLERTYYQKVFATNIGSQNTSYKILILVIFNYLPIPSSYNFFNYSYHTDRFISSLCILIC